MLKLVIADDEEFVLETLSGLINWNDLGIMLIGTCQNGIEAYHTILDETPDIVLTDIRMPGLTGLDLIEKINHMEIDTEFVILSGFGEFEYAKTAMKYGVRHYLLKPCSEAQIIEVMETVKRDCYQKRTVLAKRHQLTARLEATMIKNLFFECLSQQIDFDSGKIEYEPFVDFYNPDYELCYFYYLENHQLTACMKEITAYLNTVKKQIISYTLYVTNTLIVIFQRFDASCQALDDTFEQLAVAYQSDYKRESYANLAHLFPTLITRLRRFNTIYFITDTQNVPIYNHQALTVNIHAFAERLSNTSPTNHDTIFAELESTLTPLQDFELVKALLSSMILKLYSRLQISTNSNELIQLTEQLNHCTGINELQAVIREKVGFLFMLSLEEKKRHKDFIEKLIQYVHDNLSDPTLSLKKAAGNHLYMSADYLGKQFLKQTGFKFSVYVANARMEKAKELLIQNGSEKIYVIAEQVGCGDNPQYFSQLFKKHTQMTPTAYAKKYGNS